MKTAVSGRLLIRGAKIKIWFRVVHRVVLPLPYVQADPAAGLLSAVRAAKEGEFGTPAAFYLRRSQAEEERLRRSRAEEERPRRGGGA